MKNKLRNIIIFISMLILFTSCAQFAPKANYQIESCETHYYFDEVLKTNRITHQVCTKSLAESNRQTQDVVLKSNQKTGKLDFTAGSLSNAEETEWATALGRLLSDPAVLNAGLNTLIEALKNREETNK